MKDCIMPSGELRLDLLLMKVTWAGRYTKVGSAGNPIALHLHLQAPRSVRIVRPASFSSLEWRYPKPERPDEQLISQFDCIFSVCASILFVFVSFAALPLFQRRCVTA